MSMSKLDLAVIYTPVGGGHKAAAIAVAEAARARGLSVELLDTFEHAPKVVGRSYVTAHLTGQGAMPELYGSAYFAANHRGGAFEPIRRGFDHVAFAALTRRVVAMAPRAVVATHHLPLVVLGRARRRRELRAPLVGVITDYTAHACWAERGVDAFCVPCPRAYHELAGHDVDEPRIAWTGIPVRDAFGSIPDVRDPSSREPLRVLVTSGGFGVGPMRRIVRSFAGMTDVELTVVCGNAKGLVARVERDAARFEVRAKVLGFEKDMAARVAAAHVVVGKAGGLTVSETLTAGRPMVIVGAVPGNEGINKDMVVAGGAGYAAKASSVGALCAWLRRTRRIAAMGAAARSLVLTRAADRVLGIVDEQLAAAERRAAAA
jgi:processive 1,2-diacylglycerol beta-glucosyltransferase